MLKKLNLKTWWLWGIGKIYTAQYFRTYKGLGVFSLSI